MGILSDFFGPLEDVVGDCLDRRDRQIDREIRREIRSEEILRKWDREKRDRRNP